LSSAVTSVRLGVPTAVTLLAGLFRFDATAAVVDDEDGRLG
jgi:hypothetical protein